MKPIAALAAVSLVLFLTGCSSDDDWGNEHHPFGARGPRGMHGDPSGTAAGIKQLQSYDANKDGTLTRAEMETQLKKDFALIDKDHNGKLDAGETHAENDRRYAESGTQYSPLLDWNQDGVIDYGEFAGGMRSLFDQLDDDRDGVLSPSELKPPHGPTLEEKPQPKPMPGQ